VPEAGEGSHPSTPAPTPGEARLIGLDVGGTAIKAGAIGATSGHILARDNAAVPRDCSSEQLLNLMVELARGLEVERHLGIGVPGLLDREACTIRKSPNLSALDGLPLRTSLSGELGLPPDAVQVGNDADLAALGERWLGAGRSTASFLMVTLGTGIGGGAILDGEVYTGAGQAGEVGHVTVDPDGPPCGCGRLGCLETLASATAARRRAEARGLPAEAPGDLKLLSERAREGHEPERQVLFDIGRDLGRGLGTAVCLLDVRSFLFSGGFSNALDQLEPGIRAGLVESTYGERIARIALIQAELGEESGWIGAARLGLIGAPDQRP